MNRRWVLWGSVVLASALMLGIAVSSRWASLRADRLRFAERLVVAGRGEEALELVSTYDGPWDERTEVGRAWSRVAVAALEQQRALDALREWYYRSPETVGERELASLLASRALVLHDDYAAYERLRSVWRGHESLVDDWRLLDADAHLRQGRRDAALEILSAAAQSAPGESSRQVRLALLAVADPEEAWRHLDQAIASRPDDEVAWLFRAQLLEAAGERAAAEMAYHIALESAPRKGLFHDQLGEFYHRAGDYSRMLAAWGGAELDDRTDFVDWKIEFWRRVAVPLPEALDHEPTAGRLHDLVAMVRELPQEQYWDEARLESRAGLHRLADQRPEAAWLRVIERLRVGDEAGADALLASGQGAPWAPDLHRALLLTRDYRRWTQFDPEHRLRPEPPAEGSTRHSFLDELDRLHAGQAELSPRLAALLSSDSGPAACFLAVGWTRAALSLLHEEDLDQAPDWTLYGFAQAVRMVEGPAAALDFLTRHPSRPELRLLAAELHADLGHSDDSRRLLTELANESTPIGVQAAWRIGLTLVAQSEPDALERWLADHAALRDSVRGAELQARIALFRDNEEGAAAIYERVLAESFDAQVFLARRAFLAGDLERAESLTRGLLRELPGNPELTASLAEIERLRRERDAPSLDTGRVESSG